MRKSDGVTPLDATLLSELCRSSLAHQPRPDVIRARRTERRCFTRWWVCPFSHWFSRGVERIAREISGCFFQTGECPTPLERHRGQYRGTGQVGYGGRIPRSNWRSPELTDCRGEVRNRLGFGIPGICVLIRRTLASDLGPPFLRLAKIV